MTHEEKVNRFWNRVFYSLLIVFSLLVLGIYWMTVIEFDYREQNVHTIHVLQFCASMTVILGVIVLFIKSLINSDKQPTKKSELDEFADWYDKKYDFKTYKPQGDSMRDMITIFKQRTVR